jgi:hypothetical protein
MQTVRLVQTVALFLIVAVAASCSASKEYSSKLFAPRTAEAKDSQALALKFLDFENEKTEEKGWVSTDVIMGRDSSMSTATLDNFSKSYPASTTPKSKNDSLPVSRDSKPVLVEAKPAPVVEDPVAKSLPLGGVRPKKSREE